MGSKLCTYIQLSNREKNCSVISYGDLKNCSSNTHMPRAISVNKKYLPALSKALSVSSSHVFCLGNRKPFGGGPAGVARLILDVENAAQGIECGIGLDRDARINTVAHLAVIMLRYVEKYEWRIVNNVVMV